MSKWEHYDKEWRLPAEGEKGFIKMYPGEFDYTDRGEQCKNQCGREGMHNGRNWCWKVTGSWDYCTLGEK